MQSFEEYELLLAQHGISLEPISVSETALYRTDALAAVAMLRKTRLPILGGDVYEYINGRFKNVFPNWSVERMPNEDQELYLRRTWDESALFIRDYNEGPNEKLLFSIVLGDAIEFRP